MVSAIAGPPLAVVTGASSGIGFELARQCAQHGFDLVAAADRPLDAVAALAAHGSRVHALDVDLATAEGAQSFYDALAGRRVDVLLVTVGHDRKAFPDQQFGDARHDGGMNLAGTIALIYWVGRGMLQRRRGRILITGPMAGFAPGSLQAVYDTSKAFLDSFANTLRTELRNSGVTVTCLVPGIGDREFFESTGLLDTQLRAQDSAAATTVAEIGFHAMMDGEGDVVAGLKCKLEVALAKLTQSEARTVKRYTSST